VFTVRVAVPVTVASREIRISVAEILSSTIVSAGMPVPVMILPSIPVGNVSLVVTVALVFVVEQFATVGAGLLTLSR
jgi:hypothetical protein